ncbi:hypothetical protein HHE06_00610 [Helicobacter heilmannii]|nr:hypothetical protein HHE06_00610 [Helicobacter heilmannii]
MGLKLVSCVFLRHLRGIPLEKPPLKPFKILFSCYHRRV